ncbi:bifunctional folylpolyglutamate synthase/dihydrofolate synthase [Mucilaginibacter arboris]|uniref:Dihydrofolate synthase/folylpolyglutamate synthase n=1 Tax=Mucilaginibacter arboris TaxID=2682090 RepID=A0A7K1SVP2_9SPHI|nr:folylpolyglutamate synthase/dihydrofolate synthase family protein [Mucilaginibacter arboris]MVN21120.1 bifunctional folylpolyglutamate synthase/dihydrofolate synthase [Mucilaginibacter arboris]
MTYQQTLEYLYQQLPMFTRVGASAFKKDLTNTLLLCEKLGNPQHQFKSIHVGGTNGKGSTSHMLAAVLQMAGYKTGLYTSPHLKDFRERIRINGEMIPEQEVIDFTESQQENIAAIEPSFFEMTVAMAFDYFARKKVDVAVIEVGLGGRLDSTNVITPLLSIITNIGWDHMNLLGNTLPEIAAEKAGIIKPNVPVVIGEYQQEVAEVFTEKAKQENAPLRFASEEWVTQKTESKTSTDPFIEVQAQTTVADSTFNLQPLTFNLDLTGSYQLKNLKTVLSAIDGLRRQEFIITDDAVFTALKKVKELTGLMGRWQTLSHQPLIICDTGHNPEGIAEVLKNIAATPHQQLHFVLGMVADKDISKILALLPKDATYYFCKPDMPRGLPAEILKEQAKSFHLSGNNFSSVKEALAAAKVQAQANDLIFVGGSTFVVVEVF